jgi:hypothetical protein
MVSFAFGRFFDFAICLRSVAICLLVSFFVRPLWQTANFFGAAFGFGFGAGGWGAGGCGAGGCGAGGCGAGG